MHLEAGTEAQLLDALVDARDLDFLAQADFLARLGERSSKQVGEVLDGFFGTCRVGACERGNGVHAVEEEMRSDTRLQRAKSGTSLDFDAAPPFIRDVEIAQRQAADDGTDGDVRQEEGGVIGWKQSGRRAE